MCQRARLRSPSPRRSQCQASSDVGTVGGSHETERVPNRHLPAALSVLEPSQKLGIRICRVTIILWNSRDRDISAQLSGYRRGSQSRPVSMVIPHGDSPWHVPKDQGATVSRRLCAGRRPGKEPVSGSRQGRRRVHTTRRRLLEPASGPVGRSGALRGSGDVSPGKPPTDQPQQNAVAYLRSRTRDARAGRWW